MTELVLLDEFVELLPEAQEALQRKETEMSANIQDASSVCQACPWGRSMRNRCIRQYYYFFLPSRIFAVTWKREMTPGVATIMAGKSHGER